MKGLGDKDEDKKCDCIVSVSNVYTTYFYNLQISNILYLICYILFLISYGFNACLTPIILSLVTSFINSSSENPSVPSGR
jgi:hypothetical protein